MHEITEPDNEKTNRARRAIIASPMNFKIDVNIFIIFLNFLSKICTGKQIIKNIFEKYNIKFNQKLSALARLVYDNVFFILDNIILFNTPEI